MTTEERLTKLEKKQDTFQNDVFEAVLRSLEVNQGIGIGKRVSQDNAAFLEVTSIKKGVRFPRMTTAQRNTIVNPGAGLIIYNTTTNKLNVFTTTWEAITSV